MVQHRQSAGRRLPTHREYFQEYLVQRLFAAASVLLFALFASLPAFAQAAPPSEASRKAELVAAWKAASEAGVGGP